MCVCVCVCVCVCAHVCVRACVRMCVCDKLGDEVITSRIGKKQRCQYKRSAKERMDIGKHFTVVLWLPYLICHFDSHHKHIKISPSCKFKCIAIRTHFIKVVNIYSAKMVSFEFCQIILSPTFHLIWYAHCKGLYDLFFML